MVEKKKEREPLENEGRVIEKREEVIFSGFTCLRTDLLSC